MRSNYLKGTLKTAVLAVTILLFGVGASVAQVNLTAQPGTVTMPDGSTVPMWGYSCGQAVTGNVGTCSALNPNAAGSWSPVVITVPTGSDLTINLTNHLSFTPLTSTTPNTVPTSLVIVGQLGGGLGTVGAGCTAGTTCTTSPDHSMAQEVTWPIAAPGASPQPGNPPAQGKRAQSFGTEVAAGATTPLCWGVCGANGPALKPGTYLIESGTHPSIQGPMGLYGILVVTTAPTSTATTSGTGTIETAAGTAYPGVSYDAEIPLLLSEIDPVQNNSVNAAVNTAGFSETAVWSGQPGGCGNPSSPSYHTCYPPAVNYTPLYYMVNGVAFNKTNASGSLFATSPNFVAATPSTGTATGSILVRLVNAGLRMHVPSIVGSQTGAGSTAPAGFSLIAEDGNVLPGVPRVQSEVFMAAGKTYDVMINGPAACTAVAPATCPGFPIYDRELSLSGNAIGRDTGMLAYIGVNGEGLPSAPALTGAVAAADSYQVIPCTAAPCITLNVSDPGKGLIANDFNVYGVKVSTLPTKGTLLNNAINANGTFTYTPNVGADFSAPDTFMYQANGAGPIATVTLSAATIEAGSGITVVNDAYTSNVSTTISIKPPGILANDKDGAGYPLTVNGGSVTSTGFTTLSVDPNGGFNATVPTCTTAAGCQYTFTYKAQNSQGTVSASSATVTLTFLPASNLSVKVLDGKDRATVISDYRWVIEEDRTFFVDPANTTTGAASTTSGLDCTADPTACAVPLTFGTNFHTSYMPVVATGCTGALSCESGQTMIDPKGSGNHVPVVCDIGNGVCRTTAGQQTIVTPDQVHLDPTKHYYISVLPGDAGNPFENANLTADCTNGVAKATNPSACGHGMGGAPIAKLQITAPTTNPVTILSEPDPYPPSKLSVFVFEDDFPLNGEQDGGGGIDVLSPNEPGLGGFNITLFDDAGGTGDATGQMTYDMFNQPLVNSLAGTPDPANGGIDACPISVNSRQGTNDPTQTGITGTIVTCPKYEADGVTLSPLAGQAVVANLMPGRYGVVATPAADRIARGEEWLQTNTLDGQKAHDSFLRIGEPSFFQEYGPAGYHVSIGFANPAIINSRIAGVCGGTDPNITGTNCTNSVTGKVTTERMSRTPDERLYSSGSNDSFAFTQCYVSFGDADGEDFAFTKCDANGNFTLSGLPDGDWRITVFDQWNDMLVDGLSTPVRLSGGTTLNLHDLAMNQWQANIYTSTFFDQNGNGVRDTNEPGLTLVATNIRFRDGSYSNFNNTDLSGNAGFNEVFPLFSWYVVETDTTRYKSTGVHVVYDAGGPADGTCTSTTAPCGNSNIAGNMANTAEVVPVPSNLRVPGAFYCATADCADAGTPLAPGGNGGSTGRVDPPWVATEGWQGFSGQNSYLEFGKVPFAVGENGGIHGEVTYASTRPFDDPGLLIHTSWTPNVPGVTINLYQEGTAPDGSQSLTLVDTTKTTSWDDWAQGFRSDGVPNMNCPGQGLATGTNADLFFYSLYNQPEYLDVYNNVHNGGTLHTVPSNSQFKCFDGMHNWNQLQPAPYDGMYSFPSVTSIDPATGKPTGTNCTICIPNPDTKDTYRVGTPMLPAGKYVVEMIVPPGYELVKEEDKNILIGDNYIAPVTQQFPGLGSAIYILPDQAEVASLYNANNAQNSTQTMGRTTLPSHEGDTGSIETFWPCVGANRIVPDYISLFPQSKEVSPFAGAMRHLCDRKEVTLDDQTSALAKFWIFTSAHVAAHFTGVITDDFTSEFDPFSPQFGEKFSPPNLPVSIKDWTGTEISRVYSDQWGTYNGLTYSTWEVNPPNPTGYAPTMMVTCMNDPGPIPGPNGTMITDPLYNPQYSQFCYEIPFMPGQTQYMDTPVVPTSAFAGAGYNNPDCAYPATVPAIAEVDGDGVGPWVAAADSTTSHHHLTIKALGDVAVPNNAYSGPSATKAPYNAKTVTRHYGFGSTKGTVTIGGVNVSPANITTWNDSSIVVNVPSGVPNCAVQQQVQYGAPNANAKCGQLIITRGDNGVQSIDTVTVTIGGKAPTHVAPAASIQDAIDHASPGDMLIIDPTCVTSAGAAAACTSTGALPVATAHNELLLMWKPVRLQGVGAASSLINANTHPAGKIDAWRQRVNCLFGLALNGSPIVAPTSGNPGNPFDPTGTLTCNAGQWNYFVGNSSVPQVDRLPLEATVGWDATLNGNLAELLQEPTLMGALEGAAITVLSKGVEFPAGSNPFAADTFPTGTRLLDGSTSRSHGCGPNSSTAINPFPSNFQCNPSSIDGLGISDSSQGGGGIFVHAWGHNLQIANNRINNNAGTLSGGINVGQGEFPPQYLGGNGAVNADPGSCQSSNVTNLQLPYCHNLNVNVHNNSITSNSSTGDELFSATPAGAGGISFCTGSDFYKFNNNWVCGNLSTGDGGGFGHLGFSYNGDIEHNTFLFNQSTNPTIPANGGAILIMGAPDVDPTCGATTDQDCLPPTPNGPSDGSGPGLVINANLIMGNAAESGSGGGIRLQNINGTEVANFPNTPSRWYSVRITNNIIANNVAGWDGAGVSLQDALAVDFINNTVMSNDSTASSGVLFNTLGAPLASSGGPTCTSNCGTTSAPQPAGLVSIQNSSNLTSVLPTNVTCPDGHFAPGSLALNGTCRTVSYPRLANNVFWQNRSFYIGVGTLGLGTQNQQNVVALYNAFTSTQVASEPSADVATPNGGGVVITGGTGACVPGSSYWDIGVRGDTGPGNHASTVTLNPTNSILTDTTGYSAASAHNIGSNPTVLSQYCNGSRTPPEFKSSGYQVPPGISDATVPNPLFNLTPAATVDEGNNWINISWGPLSLTNASNNNSVLGNYGLAAGSPAIDTADDSVAPPDDYFGHHRPLGKESDIGAVEFQAPPVGADLDITPQALAFGNVPVGATSQAQTVTLNNTGNATLTGISLSFSSGFSRSGGTCPANITTLAAGASCTIGVVFSPTTTGPAINANLTVNSSNDNSFDAAQDKVVSLTGTGIPRIVSAQLRPTSHNFGNVTRGNQSGTQTFTFTNTGNVTLTGIGQAALGGTNPTEFSIVRFLSTCGPAGNGQFAGQTTLNPGTSCFVTVRFAPLTTQTTGAKSATVSVSSAAPTQTSTLTGNAQ